MQAASYYVPIGNPKNPPLGGLTLPNPIKQKEKKKEIKKEKKIEREKIYSAYVKQRRRNIFLTHIFSFFPDN